MKLELLLDIMYAELLNAPYISAFSNIAFDLRDIHRGSLLFLTNDDIVIEAIQKGAYGIITDTLPSPAMRNIDNEIAWIYVEDMQQGMRRLLRYLLMQGNVKLVYLTNLELYMAKDLMPKIRIAPSIESLLKTAFDIEPNGMIATSVDGIEHDGIRSYQYEALKKFNENLYINDEVNYHENDLMRLQDLDSKNLSKLDKNDNLCKKDSALFEKSQNIFENGNLDSKRKRDSSAEPQNDTKIQKSKDSSSLAQNDMNNHNDANSHVESLTPAVMLSGSETSHDSKISLKSQSLRHNKDFDMHPKNDVEQKDYLKAYPAMRHINVFSHSLFESRIIFNNLIYHFSIPFIFMPLLDSLIDTFKLENLGENRHFSMKDFRTRFLNLQENAKKSLLFVQDIKALDDLCAIYNSRENILLEYLKAQAPHLRVSVSDELPLEDVDLVIIFEKANIVKLNNPNNTQKELF